MNCVKLLVLKGLIFVLTKQSSDNVQIVTKKCICYHNDRPLYKEVRFPDMLILVVPGYVFNTVMEASTNENNQLMVMGLHIRNV